LFSTHSTSRTDHDFLHLLACLRRRRQHWRDLQTRRWYESLVKPSFTPPNWLFPVAWTIIYLLLAWAGYRLTLIPGSEMVLALWAAQIALNTLWTPVFFGAHRLLAGMVIIVLLWLTVAAMVLLAVRLDLITGLILFPYLVWLCVAAALNFSILRNNR